MWSGVHSRTGWSQLHPRTRLLQGGAIHSSDKSDVTVESCTFSGNTAVRRIPLCAVALMCVQAIGLVGSFVRVFEAGA